MSIDKPATHADLIGDVIDRVVLAPNSNTVLYSSRNCMFFIPESCSHDTLLTAFHGFIRGFKYGIGTLTCSNVLNQNLSLEKMYSIGVDG